MSDIFHTYIKPIKFTTISETVKVTIMAMLKLKPRRRKVTTKMAAEIDKNRTCY